MPELTDDQLEQALRGADAKAQAGDQTALGDAKLLAQEFARRKGAGAPPPTPASPPTSNPLYGALQTTEQSLGGAATLLSKGRSYVQSHVLGNPGDDPATSTVRGWGDNLDKAAAGINYDPGTYQDAYQQGGVPGVAVHFGKEAVANAPHLAAALNPVTLGVDLAGQTETNAEQRAKNDNRQDPGASDYLAGAGAAAVQEAAGRVGARSIVAPTAKSVLARIAQSTLTGAATGAAGSEAQYLGTTAGTQQGTTPQGVVDSAVEGAGAGAVSGLGARSVAERPPLDRTAANGLKGEAIVAKQGEEQSASNMRVAQMAEQVRKSADDAGTGGMVPQDSNAYKTVQGSLIQKLRSTVDDLAQSGQIDKEERRSLIGQRGSLLDEAAIHNRVFGQDHLDRIDRMDLGDDVKQALQDGFRDLNTSTYNAMYKNGTGPLEKAAKFASYPVAAGMAGAMGLEYGPGGAASAVLVPTVAKGIQAAGRFGDQLLGNRTPPAEASLTALRAAALKRQSLADAAARDTHGALETIRGQSRQQAQALADFKRAADDETTFQAQQAKTQAEKDAAAKEQEKAKAASERQGLREFAEAARQEQEFQAQREAVRKARETPPAPPITPKPPLPPSVQAIKDAQEADRPFSKLSSSYLQGRARSLLKERAEQQEAASKEAARQRLSGSVSPDAPISGGHVAEVAKWFQDSGIPATNAHVLEAIDRINRRGGFSSPEEFQAAKAGVRFPNYGDGLTPLFRETSAVLREKGVGATRDSRAAVKADAAIVRAKTKAIVEAAQPKAPRSPTEAPSVANTNRRPPQAPPIPRGPRKAPGGAPTPPPSTTGFEEGRRLHAYAATTFRAKMAEEQAIRSAGNRLDLQETASHIADLEHKDAKAQAYEEALKKFHGDAEALRFVMGPLRTLAGIGGKSEQTANQKAVIKVRSKKKSS